MADDSSNVARELEILERLLLDADLHGIERVAELLCEDFQEFGVSGRVFDKSEVLAALSDGPRVPLSASDFSVALLSPALALVTYRALRRGQPPVASLRSSLWRHEAGRWRLRFHQGTLVQG